MLMLLLMLRVMLAQRELGSCRRFFFFAARVEPVVHVIDGVVFIVVAVQRSM